MEILSIGEKMKRCRIYKGYKLKEICGDAVSVSKLSCIENDKIVPEDWIIDIVAKKLEIDPEYLKKDIKEQLISNLQNLCLNCKDEETEEIVKYNLECAETYEYYDIAFKLMHLLYSYYLKMNNLEMCFFITPKYYSLLVKSCDKCSGLVYYLDIATYFFLTEEYIQAANYYSNVRSNISDKDNDMLWEATYKEALCYYLLDDYQGSYLIASKLIDSADVLNKSKKKAEIYSLIGMLYIKLGKNQYSEYEKKAYKFCENDLMFKAQIMLDFGAAMISTKFSENIKDYIIEAISYFPKEDKKKLINFMIKVVDILTKINEIDHAKVYCDSLLDYAINLNCNEFIEKAYYHKAKLMIRQGNINMCEMYMNLSLDIIMKFGTKNEIYKRFLDIGNMYYNMENAKEAIKYFSLAMKLHNEI